MKSILALTAILTITPSTLKLVDISGRKCGPEVYHGLVYVLVVANKTNEAEAYDATVALALKYLDKREMQPVVLFDLRSLFSMLHWVARQSMETTQKRAVQEITDKLAAAGKPKPADLDKRTHLVPDEDGEVAQAFGIDEEAPHPIFIVLDPQGLVKARFVGIKQLDALSSKIQSLIPHL